MTKTEKNTPEPSESAPRIVATKDLFELTFNAMAREVDTSRARVTRFMTFNGFLIAALALLEKLDQSDPLRILLL